VAYHVNVRFCGECGHAVRTSNVQLKFAGVRPRSSKFCVTSRVDLWVQPELVHNNLILRSNFQFWEDTPTSCAGPFKMRVNALRVINRADHEKRPSE
jgi:hypothetical protein